MNPTDNDRESSQSTLPLSASDRLAALRIIDANFNRASEGMRVVEEHCRFALADRHLTECCKQLRHDLAAAVESLPAAQLHAARESQSDVGVTISTE
jgi:thiamine-phosphate pyrophosphorylase